MRIALFGTDFSNKYLKYIQHLILKLTDNSEVIIYEEFYNFLHSKMIIREDIRSFKNINTNSNIDLLLSIGGDGTLLRSITYVKDTDIPILGINTGRLGFISSISTDQIDIAIDKIIKNDYTIQNRTLINLETNNNLFGDLNLALNEISITKKDTSSMIRIDAFIFLLFNVRMFISEILFSEIAFVYC